jgi:NAD(P)-dependent dehydrogenase (short-subunit alcohol dehydrogenase family)
MPVYDLNGKVALVTGAARGIGYETARQLHMRGASVAVLDIDAAEAREAAERIGPRAIGLATDVTDHSAVMQSVAETVERFGRLDVVVANAGICPLGSDVPIGGFVDAFDVDFIGVINTVHAALPYLRAGASVITIGSVAGLIAETAAGSVGPVGPGGEGYNLAKQLIDRYTRALAKQLAPLSIRANVVHPTNVNSPMLNSEPMYRTFRPDLERPTKEDALLAFPVMQAMPIPYMEPEDTSNAVCFLASDESRYVTGLQFKVDAGATLKF